MNAVVESLRQAGTSILTILQLGGPVVAILLAMSILALAITFLKLWQFRAARIGDRRTARSALNIYRVGSTGEALGMASRSPNPAAQVLTRAIRGRQRTDLSESAVREELMRYGSDRLESLRAYLRPLEVIASIAPLLGLFGTVLGMIEAFHDLEQAGSRVDPAVLSGGIWQALLTTAVGLGVAMPVILILNWLERSVDRLAHEMDNIVTQIFTEDLSKQPRSQEHGHDDYSIRAPSVPGDT